MIKQRYQNPVLNDTVSLKLFVYNGNNLADVVSVDGVNIYICDPAEITMENPIGKRLVATLDPDDVVRDDTGTYHIDVLLESPLYTTGKYTDEWILTVDSDLPAQTIENEFKVYTQLWYTTPIPIVYDFAFDFQPNKIRQGSKQYLRIKVTPNVPRASDLKRYYENLAIVGDVKVSLEQKCGPCVPQDPDLRLIIDEESVCYKEKCYGYYLLDTDALELDCGIYAVWFTLCVGDNKYISDSMNLQIFR